MKALESAVPAFRKQTLYCAHDPESARNFRSLTCCQHRLLVRFRHLKRSAERSQSTVAGESGPKPNSIATDPCDSSSARYHLATVSQASAPTSPPFLSRRMLPRILLFVVLSNLSIRYREGSHRISSLTSACV